MSSDVDINNRITVTLFSTDVILAVRQQPTGRACGLERPWCVEKLADLELAWELMKADLDKEQQKEKGNQND